MNALARLKDYIQAVLKRPAMYGVSSVDDIALIIRGYKQACSESGLQEVVVFFDGFNAHVASELGDTTQSWEKVIRFQSGGALDSIRLFGDLYNAFLNPSAGASVRRGEE